MTTQQSQPYTTCSITLPVYRALKEIKSYDVTLPYVIRVTKDWALKFTTGLSIRASDGSKYQNIEWHEFGEEGYNDIFMYLYSPDSKGTLLQADYSLKGSAFSKGKPLHDAVFETCFNFGSAGKAYKDPLTPREAVRELVKFLQNEGVITP